MYFDLRCILFGLYIYINVLLHYASSSILFHTVLHINKISTHTKANFCQGAPHNIFFPKYNWNTKNRHLICFIFLKNVKDTCIQAHKDARRIFTYITQLSKIKVIIQAHMEHKHKYHYESLHPPIFFSFPTKFSCNTIQNT